MDRISNLPDEILCQILCFFPTTKEAASTSLLSKRWRNLFAFSPNLSFKGREEGHKADYVKHKANITTSTLVDFVDRVLAVSGNSTIRKFSLNIKQSGISPHIYRWMMTVLTRGITDLELEHYIGNVVNALPLEIIFTCKTIVNLKLLKLSLKNKVPENASLPALKTLFLDCVLFSGCAFESLISACHVLEELTLSTRLFDLMYGQNVSSYPTVVSCPTLKWLSLTCVVSLFDDSRSIIIDTPRLTSLVYDDFVVDEYLVVNLESLIEAQISLWKRSNRKRNPVNLIKGLRNVKILNLSSLRTSKVLYSFAESVPLFKNLTRLSVEIVFPSVHWKLIPLLLKKSPNLETLVIKGPKIYKDKYNYGEESQSLIRECLSECTSLSACLVKVLEITRYRGTKGELEQMKYFVEKLPCLELVNVRASFDAKVTLTPDMLMLPKDSLIQLNFFPYKTHE